MPPESAVFGAQAHDQRDKMHKKAVVRRRIMLARGRFGRVNNDDEANEKRCRGWDLLTN